MNGIVKGKDLLQTDEAELTLFSELFEIEKFDFLNAVNTLSKEKKDFFYWNEPAENFSILGFGKAFEIRENGEDRTHLTDTIVSNLKENLSANWTERDDLVIPLFVGGIKFSPHNESLLWKDFSDADWFIPKHLYFRQDEKFFYVFNASTEKEQSDFEIEIAEGKNFPLSLQTNGVEKAVPKIISSNIEDEEDRRRWYEMVETALEFIRKKDFKKIVLSREVKLQLDSPPSIGLLLEKLNSNYPHCYIYAYSKNGSVFFGASPEKLAKFNNGWIEADALAGSIPRGKDKSEDKILETELLKSRKNINEQKAVVDFISRSFQKFSTVVEYDPKPTVRKLPNIQHLWTPIRAKLSKGKTIFNVIEEVHPTPAICGAPWTEAMSSILEMEKHDRGLYTGAIGWFNFKNEGEFAVAIRSALLQGKTVTAYAGCGIVEGSDPESEFEETKLKLKPILNLFQR